MRLLNCNVLVIATFFSCICCHDILLLKLGQPVFSNISESSFEVKSMISSILLFVHTSVQSIHLFIFTLVHPFNHSSVRPSIHQLMILIFCVCDLWWGFVEFQKTWKTKLGKQANSKTFKWVVLKMEFKLRRMNWGDTNHLQFALQLENHHWWRQLRENSYWEGVKIKGQRSSNAYRYMTLVIVIIIVVVIVIIIIFIVVVIIIIIITLIIKLSN